MKVHNAVVGMEVQVKRDCRGHSDEFLKGGLVCTVSRIDDGCLADYELRLDHPDIDCGYAWVNASDVRRYTKPTESPEPVVESDEPPEDIRVGDSVLVGAEGAGYGCVLEKYAGLTCLVTSPHRRADCMYITHPDVRGGSPYASLKKYLTKVTQEPVSTEPTDSLKVGDYIVAQDGTITLDDKVPYRVVDTSVATLVGIALSTSRHTGFRKCFYIKRSAVIKILREVYDATPRVVQSGSESTCRSE